MKRVWIILLAILTAAVFCACGSENPQKAEPTEEPTESPVMSYVLKPAADGKKIDASTMSVVKSILETRLAGTGEQYTLTLDDAANQISVTCPGTLSTDLLTGKGDFVINDVDGEKKLGNEDVKSASVKIDESTGEQYMLIVFTDTGAEAFADVTRAAVGQKIEVYLDSEVLCAPTVYAPITEGEAEIRNGFTPEKTVAYANIINAGAMPFPLEIVSSQPAV